MTRLTGNDAFGLMEAYNSMYAPQELTEEQIHEDFGNWVYSLMEEGYDLSEYTWDEMFDVYIDEAVKGSQRSIGNRITGNDIRQVSRGERTIYKKPKWQDDAAGQAHGETHGRTMRRRGEKENTDSRRERENADDNAARNRATPEKTVPTGRRLRDRARNR